MGIKLIRYSSYSLAGFSGATLLSFAGHLWLPKSALLWGILPMGGVGVFWLLSSLAIAAFGAACVLMAAKSHAEQGLPFGLAGVLQALLPAVGLLLTIIVVNGVALWLAL